MHLADKGLVDWFFRTRNSKHVEAKSSNGRLILAAAILLWLPAVALGVQVLLRYSNTPGRLATPPADWPRGSEIRPERHRPVLLVFAHPQCPCTRATIGELALIMARSENSAWAKTDLWLEAASIPGGHSIEDRDGREIRRFGASTSGGITAIRGNAGPNDGRDAILSPLDGGTAPRRAMPVFGYSLLGVD